MATVEKPRLRNPSGQYSARGVVTAALLRSAYSKRPRTRGPSNNILDQTPAVFSEKGTDRLIEFNAVNGAPDKVDKVNAIIRGVSVITSGVMARGHDLCVDDQTLLQMKNCADEKVQVPVKVDHKSGAAAVCGYLCNFHHDGNKLKADWYLLQSHPQKDQILEVAERMPRGVGLSAAFVAEDKPGRTPSGGKAARCKELISVDYVTLPAANPDGMFAAKVDTHTNAMNPEILAAIEAAVKSAIAPVAQQVADQGKQLNLIANPPTLEEVAKMDDAQLAEIGLTKEDVQAALEGLEQEHSDEPVLTEAEKAAADAQAKADLAKTTAPGAQPANAAPAVAAPAATAALEALTKQVTELSSKFKAAETAKEKAEVETLFSQTEKKIQALADENAHLREAVKSGGRPLTAGVSRGGVRFFSADASKGEFENLVQLNVEEKKVSKTVAFQTVIKENPDAYQDYLVRLGVAKARE